MVSRRSTAVVFEPPGAERFDTSVRSMIGDFVFLDARLACHPRVYTTVHFAPKVTSTLPPPILGVPTDGPRHGGAWALDAAGRPLHVVLPFPGGKRSRGRVVLYSPVRTDFADETVETAMLMTALISFLVLKPEEPGAATAALALAEGLRQIRRQTTLSQADLAARLGMTSRSLSSWETGAAGFSVGQLDAWCRALGVLSAESRLVTQVDITPELLRMLQEDPQRLRGLSPAQFERFVAERLDRMGFDVSLTGETTCKDGGIDLIAVPKVRTAGAYLLAAQVKHHRADRKTRRDAVDRLLAWKGREFHLGMLVTNTDFTREAYWLAMLQGNREFLRLRNFEDLKRWLQDKFTDPQDWREMPDEIELAPGLKVKVPKPRLTTPLKDWSMSTMLEPGERL